MLDERGIEGVRVLQGLLSMTGKYTAGELETACELALSHGAWRLRALRSLIKSRARQQEFDLVQSHPLIRPMADYGRWLKVSFRKGNDNGNGEFIAWGAPGGKSKEKGPERCRALPAVQPPTTALGSLSSGALSSVPAIRSVHDDPAPVKAPERMLT